MLDVIAQVSQDTTLRGVYSEKMWLQYLIWSVEIIIESIQKLGGIYTDCRGGNIVPCRWPVGPDEDFDFAVVDAGGLWMLHHGKGGINKCRQHLEGLLDRCSQLHNPVFRNELERLVKKVKIDANFFRPS